ncbi:Serine/threonine protein kinase, partial [Phytophthora palmivora]
MQVDKPRCIFQLECYNEDQPDKADLLVTLFAASKADDFIFVEYLAANFEIDLCHVNEHGRTALHEAAAGDGVEVAKTLLAYRVKVSHADKLGITPIIEASRYGNAHVLGCLLSAEWNTEDVDVAGRTALHHAATGGHVNVIDILLYDADVNCCDKRGWTPLHCAAASGRLEALKMLIEHGAMLDVETISGKTPLVLAIERGQSDVAAFLMEQSLSGIESKTTTEPTNSTKDLLADYEEYHLNPNDIQFDSPLLQDSAKGTWLGSPIEVKVKKNWQSKNFVEELRQWSALSHPHVVKMYGFCCGDDVVDPFFVYERPAYLSLFEYFKDKRTELWDKMYEAAMGIEYLHDRDIVHGDISCISIAVASNGLAKLKNLGSENDENKFRQNPTWTSPELLSGSPATFQSDVYMFGLTIVQAFKTTGDVWDIFGGARDEAIRSGMPPLKPADMTAAQWQLIERMCSFNPSGRLSASDVVRELEVFTHKSQQFISSLHDKSILQCWENLGDHEILDAITSAGKEVVTVGSILADVDATSKVSSPANDMIRDVYKRLMDIFQQLKIRTDTPSIDLVERYSSILSNFFSRLKFMESFNLPHAARIVTIRQTADTCFSVHRDIDLFMETAALVHSTDIPVWREQWELLRNKQKSMVLEKLGDVSVLLKDAENDKERVVAMTYLRFEMTKHANSYILSNVNDITRSKEVVAAFAVSKNPDWFIPAFEVEFNAQNQFNSGSFGSVHRGKWKHAQVVVKKLNLKTTPSSDGSDSLLSGISSIGNSSSGQSSEGFEADFLNEVEIWHKLYHPNVVQLFGACHIGTPIFVCEYAGGGQLDEYLRAHPKEIVEKLYEAALGLRYLHEKRVVHNDLKCNNILIGNDGLAKLTDFGL